MFCVIGLMSSQRRAWHELLPWRGAHRRGAHLECARRCNRRTCGRAVGSVLQSAVGGSCPGARECASFYTARLCKRRSPDEHNGLTHSDTEAPASSNWAGWPTALRVSSRHALAKFRSTTRPTTAWSENAVRDPFRQRNERSRRSLSLARTRSDDASAPQAVQQPSQPGRHAAGLRLGPVPAARADRGTLAAGGPHLGSPGSVSRPRMATARHRGRAPARPHRNRSLRRSLRPTGSGASSHLRGAVSTQPGSR